MTPAFERNLWNVAAAAWGVAEATLFFIVPDVLLSVIGLRQGVRAGWVACLCAALGASVGGAIMHRWSAHDSAGARGAVLAVPAISEAMVDAAGGAMAERGWFIATLEGPLSSTPFKVYALLAPHAGARVGVFAIASFAARLPRFLLAALSATLLRRLLEPRIGITRSTYVLVLGWVIFYLVFFALMPG